MALTAATRFYGPGAINVVYTQIGEPALHRIDWATSTLEFGGIDIVGYGRPPVSGENGYDELVILQEIYASSDGFRDADGNSITILVQGFTYGTTLESIEEHGFYNPLDPDSYARYLENRKVAGAHAAHAEVEEDSITGRKDVVTTGGLRVKKGVPPSGDLDQSIADWFAEVRGSNARIGINALPGAPYDIGSSTESGTEVESDVRVRAMIVKLESIRTAGDALYDDDNPLSGITEWSQSIFSGRTFSLPFNSLGDLLVFTIGTTTSGPSRLTFNITRTSASEPVYIDDINETINNTTVTFPTENADEKPPFGDTTVPALMERAVMPGGSLVVDRGLAALWTPTKRIPIGAREILTWDNLTVVPGETYREIPFGYFNFAIHVESTGNRVIRIPDPSDIVPYIEGAIEFEVHNNNGYDDSSVELQRSNGTNIITLLGTEAVPLELEWFKDGTGELRSAQRIPRILSVAGSDTNHFNSVGYWDMGNGFWGRPIPIPPVAQRTKALRINEEAFLLGADTWTNGSNFANIDGLHIPHAPQLLKTGRLTVDLQLVISGQDSGSINNHQLNLYQIEGSSEILAATYPQEALGVGEQRPWDIYYQQEGGDININDIFMPVYRYAKSSTMNPSDIRIRSYRQHTTLEQDILVTYA